MNAAGETVAPFLLGIILKSCKPCNNKVMLYQDHVLWSCAWSCASSCAWSCALPCAWSCAWSCASLYAWSCCNQPCQHKTMIMWGLRQSRTHNAAVPLSMLVHHTDQNAAFCIPVNMPCNQQQACCATAVHTLSVWMAAFLSGTLSMTRWFTSLPMSPATSQLPWAMTGFLHLMHPLTWSLCCCHKVTTCYHYCCWSALLLLSTTQQVRSLFPSASRSSFISKLCCCCYV